MEAERGAGTVEHYDGNVCSQSWYRLRTHLGRLHEGSVVCNTALMGARSYGQRTVQARLRVEHWRTVGGGQSSIRVLGLAIVNHRDSGLSYRPGDA